ncbi:10692_t:CDS:2, partial [Dentiscutata heterogama]
MPFKRSNAKKVSNSYFKKKNSQPTTDYPDHYIFRDKIYTSFPVDIDETGARFSAFIKLTSLQKDRIVRMIISLYSFLNYNNKLSEASFNSLVAYKKTKEYKTYTNAKYNYVASKAQWFFTQSIPLSVATIWFFGTVTSFMKNTKNTEVRIILFESDIQYKEIAVKLVNTIINDQYIFYRN